MESLSEKKIDLKPLFYVYTEEDVRDAVRRFLTEITIDEDYPYTSILNKIKEIFGSELCEEVKE